MKKRVAILGASRGLGFALAQEVMGHPVPTRPATGSEGTMTIGGAEPDVEALLLASRHPNTPAVTAGDATTSIELSTLTIDFADPLSVERILSALKAGNYRQIFYVAGGGPFGSYWKKEWKDHAWSFQVSFQTPAQILHGLSRIDRRDGVQGTHPVQFIAIGSAIAENRPEIHGAAYAASKRALRGLIESIQLEDAFGRAPTVQRESSSSNLDVRLYSPGYMDTNLLPKNAWPRREGKPILDVSVVARDLWMWASDSTQRGQNRTFDN